MNAQERAAGFDQLRKPFPPEAIGKIPRGGIQLDYVGHAETTDRLLTVDPEWTWEPFSLDERGMPALVYDKNGWPIGLWINLTVLGVTRPGYGSCAPGKQDAVKELIGDALRNAAMRFGVALALWSKDELESTLVQPSKEEVTSSDAAGGSTPPTQASPRVASEPSQAKPTRIAKGERETEAAEGTPADAAASPANHPRAQDRGATGSANASPATQPREEAPGPVGGSGASSWAADALQKMHDDGVSWGSVAAKVAKVALAANVRQPGNWKQLLNEAFVHEDVCKALGVQPAQESMAV